MSQFRSQRTQLRPGGHNHRAFGKILQLPDVSRPVVFLNGSHGLARDTVDDGICGAVPRTHERNIPPE